MIKKSILLLGFLAVVFLPITYIEAAPRIAVIPFNDQNVRKVSESNLYDVMDLVQTMIVQTKRFDPCDRTPADIQRAMDEMRINNTSAFNPATSSKLGEMLGAQYLVLGTITGLTTKKNGEIAAHLSLRMIEVETARIFLAGRGTGKSKDDSHDALEKAAKDALNGEMGMLTMLRGGK